MATTTINALQLEIANLEYIPATIEMGQDLKRGTVLGLVTNGQKAKATVSTAADGSQVPKFVLIEDIDTTDGDTKIQVIACGRVVEECLIFTRDEDNIDTVVDNETMREHLRKYGILAQSVDVFTN